jgi:hypothetical protein
MSPMPIIPIIASAILTGATSTQTSYHCGWQVVLYTAS